MTNASFNGNLLSTFNGVSGILVQNIEHAGKSARQAQTYALSHGNRSSIPYVEYPSRPITITGQIVGTSISDEDNQIDIFNGLLSTPNAALCFDYKGGSLNRLYTATATNVDVQRPGGLAWANFTITFTATSPFGQDTTLTTLLSATGRTLGSYSDLLSFGGTAPFQTPVITITYAAIGSSPALGTVIVGNDATGQAITITRTWSTGDVLLIDTSLSTNTPVTVNGSPVDWTDALPAFFTGSGTLDYSDTFASRTFGITATYYKNYL
jgi:hypothetical protein